MPDTDARVRQFHTRSRTGCSNCRTRRKRCDEQRPQCYNCVKGQRTCTYAPVKIPLRERRAQQKEAQPWEQTPWQVAKTEEEKQMVCMRKTTVPLRLSRLNQDVAFNKLAIAMPLRSHELFQYLFTSCQPPKNVPEISRTEYLSRLIDDPCALRSAILMAGMHFTFQYGDLSCFESTLLFHKVEVMRGINTWIASKDYRLEASIIRQMATLAFTEACHGELVAAETHISGILALIETAKVGRNDPTLPDSWSTDQELANRYFVMSYVYLTGLKSLLGGICRTGGYANSIDALPGRKLVKLSYIWHSSEALESLALKLQAIRLFPFFFSPLAQGARLNNADGAKIITSLREFTIGINPLFMTQGADTMDAKFESFWRQGPASRVLAEYVMAHVQSISIPGEKVETPEMPTSTFIGPWCGWVVASIIYMQDVLRVLEPLDRRIHKYAITIFQHDVAKNLAVKGTSRNDEFLFWLVMVGLTVLSGGSDTTGTGVGYFKLVGSQTDIGEGGMARWECQPRVFGGLMGRDCI
ncbi:Sterol regulatory element-binding protein ECM22 [Fusarium austroafricanum]|uniref:Sterol regulatory element-binding protein ECM22 n=1 Tax=Fusarium austroafricanum TaxID=2364996 RepID=A0A8H4KJB6_9HYPO|nr:Sterol regulatory element-binding protein ECM22 [Fusarium austroafricanum]